jgi:hypothetical protein
MNYERTKQACGFFILPPSTIILSTRRVSPGECGFTSSDGIPGTNGVISKTRCGTWNQHYRANFASASFGRARLCRADQSASTTEKFHGSAELRPTPQLLGDVVRQLVGRCRRTRQSGQLLQSKPGGWHEGAKRRSWATQLIGFNRLPSARSGSILSENAAPKHRRCRGSHPRAHRRSVRCGNVRA